MTGTMLVLATWAMCWLSIVVLGLPIALARGRGDALETLRRSSWIGLLIATVALLALSLVAPMSSIWVLVAMTLLVLLAFAGAVWILRNNSEVLVRSRSALKTAFAILFVVACSAAIYLSIAALGPVTNYDTGLYHLGAIRYLSDFGTIHGLANLFNPFGYSNSQFVLAAFLGNGPWSGEGFRLLNGLFVIFFLTELVMRFRRNKRRPGDYVMLVGAGLCLVPLIAMADYLVTSPTSDTAVMVLSLIASAYLTDAVASKRLMSADGSVALAAAGMAFLMRPTMVIFLIGIIFVIAYILVRRRISPFGDQALLTWVAGIFLTGAVLQGIRDFYLSGWLFYPLSILSFGVPWQSPDPAANRAMTLAVARDPINYSSADHGWEWVQPWLARLLTQWEFYEILAAFAGVFVCLIYARSSRPLELRRMSLAMAPALVSVVFWWLFTPPSFRFAWGPIFSLVAISGGWLLWRMGERRTLPKLAVPVFSILIIMLIGYCALWRLDPGLRDSRGEFRLGPISIGFTMSAVRIPATIPQTLGTGVTLLIPTESDQCWASYPMCTAFTDTAISYRGQGIADGFLP